MNGNGCEREDGIRCVSVRVQLLFDQGIRPRQRVKEAGRIVYAQIRKVKDG